MTWFYTRPLVILLGQSPRLQGTGAVQHRHGAAGTDRTEPRVAGAGGRRRGRWRVSDDENRSGEDGSALDDVSDEDVEDFEQRRRHGGP